ncbi:MAG: hypothetical protein MN733_37455 [Nitrososphaera sp.]|nr:hypothetical protein [Nitrososphaera sp.]
MSKVVVEFTQEEKAELINHLEGLSDLYIVVNGSGDGPLSALVQKIKLSQLAMEFDYFETDRLLRHLKGASSYDKVVLGSDPLRSILEKIEHAQRG